MKKYLLHALLCTFLILILTGCSKPKAKSQSTTSISESTTSTTTSSTDPHSVYAAVLSSAMGPITYYNQNDARWYDHLYGKQDVLSIYGCGPTTLASLVSSFFDPQMTPDKMADWAYENGYWASKNGSYHTIISEGLSSLGFQVKGLSTPSKETITSSLKSGHILVALMGKGHFTEEGHFILILDVDNDGTLHIADVNSYENTKKTWKISTILNELKTSATAGGPVWEISLP